VRGVQQDSALCAAGQCAVCSRTVSRVQQDSAPCAAGQCTVCSRTVCGVPSAGSTLLAFFSVFGTFYFIPSVSTCYSRLKVFGMIAECNAIGNLPKIKFVALKSYSLQLVLAFDVFYSHFCVLISVDFYFLCLPVQVET
jgi:hypothetical protein